MALSCALRAENKPECARGAICFSGQVSEGQEFRKKINADLEFVLEPGWKIRVIPTHPNGDCKELAGVVNPPYRGHNELYLDMSYGWTAGQGVSASPREFRFVTNCADYRVEADRLNIVLWPYTWPKEKQEEALDKLGTSPAGTGRLWITGSRLSEGRGRIEWMKFSVEIRLPRNKR